MQLFAYLSFLFASSLVIMRMWVPFPSLFQPAERSTLSHTLWEHNKVIVGLTFALLLANTGSFIYSSWFLLPGIESPEYIVSCGHISRALGWRYLSD